MKTIICSIILFTLVSACGLKPGSHFYADEEHCKVLINFPKEAKIINIENTSTFVCTQYWIKWVYEGNVFLTHITAKGTESTVLIKE